jgi:2-iminobutanoate/2-iminopropanoate deaminase
MKNILSLQALLLLALTGPAQTSNNIEKQKWHYGTVNQDTTYGYAGVVKVGNTLYLSGVTASGDFATQVSSIYRRLEINLQKFGASFQNVVKENLYTLNIDSMKYFDYLRKPFYKGDFPAATWVQVSRLFTPDRMLEVDLIAVLPEQKTAAALPWPGNQFVGTWAMQTKKSMLYESWENAGTGLLKGKSYKLLGADTLVLERVELKQTGDGIYYIPTVENQNNNQPVFFKLSSAQDGKYVFENPQHDFPKRITYHFTGTGELHAWIDDGTEKGKRNDFNYKKMQ